MLEEGDDSTTQSVKTDQGSPGRLAASAFIVEVLSASPEQPFVWMMFDPEGPPPRPRPGLAGQGGWGPFYLREGGLFHVQAGCLCPCRDLRCGEEGRCVSFMTASRRTFPEEQRNADFVAFALTSRPWGRKRLRVPLKRANRRHQRDASQDGR